MQRYKRSVKEPVVVFKDRTHIHVYTFACDRKVIKGIYSSGSENWNIFLKSQCVVRETECAKEEAQVVSFVDCRTSYRFAGCHATPACSSEDLHDALTRVGNLLATQDTEQLFSASRASVIGSRHGLSLLLDENTRGSFERLKWDALKKWRPLLYYWDSYSASNASRSFWTRQSCHHSRAERAVNE